MKTQSSEFRYENITRECLNMAAEMFIYLTACPGRLTLDIAGSGGKMEKWFLAWYRFYDDLFKTKSPDKIVSTERSQCFISGPFQTWNWSTHLGCQIASWAILAHCTAKLRNSFSPG